MAIQQFELLKKSAVTEIQADLEAAVLADRLLAESARDAAQLAQTAAETAETNAELAETNAELAETNAEAAKDLAVAAANAFPATNPQVSYNSRVLADLGSIKDLDRLTELYMNQLNLLPYTHFMWDGNAGYKVVDGKLTKAYSMDNAGNDGTTLAGTEPYAGGGIAQNESRSIKINKGQSVQRKISHAAFSKLSTSEWTSIFCINPKKDITIQFSETDVFILSKTQINLYTADGLAFSIGNNNIEYGKNNLIEIQFSNSSWLIKINGIVQILTSSTARSVNFQYISEYVPELGINDFEIKSYQLINKRISAYESQLLNELLRLQHPEIEGINIGNQHWATSNYEGVVTGNGTVIPEVQDPTAWAALTTPAWCYYNNDASLGAIYGKLYNWYAVAEIAKNPPAGWRVPSSADFTQLQTYLGGSTVAGGKMKALYGGFNNEFATNESGFSLIASGARDESGVFYSNNQDGILYASDNVGETIGIFYSASFLSNGLSSNVILKKIGLSLRLLRNSPVGSAEETISQTIAANTDYTSTALQMPMKFGYRASLIRITSENELTSVEVKLHNSAGTAVATLITAKSVAAGVTMVFPVLADYATLLNDGTLRMTAVGNVGSTVGGKFEATCQKEIFS